MNESEATSPGSPLLEPASPENLVPDIGLWPWWLAAAVLIAFLIVLFFVLRRKSRRPSDPAIARNIAYSEAITSFEKTPASFPRDAAIHSSLILRRYLAAAADDPALFETHEEFISRHDSLKELTPEVRSVATTEFSHLAAMKYAPQDPTDDPAGVIADAKSLLDTLHRGFAA